jgi:hypothetical protein
MNIISVPGQPGNTSSLIALNDAAEAVWPIYPQPPSLAAVHRSWGLPDDRLIRWLLDQGVRESAMLEPWPLGGARVLFDGCGFDVVPDGELAVTFRIDDCGEVLDLAAWAPRSGKMASWCGVGFAIGQDQIFNPASYFDGGALRVHADPLAWLKADRDGVVIVKPELTYAYLRNVRRLSFADPALARQVERWLEPPQAGPELLVEVVEELAA